MIDVHINTAFAERTHSESCKCDEKPYVRKLICVILAKTNHFDIHLIQESVRKAKAFNSKHGESATALRACVYIYIQQLSSFRVPMEWFIDLTVATCHIQYTFLS